MSGENKNCMAANDASNQPPHGDASEIVEPNIPLNNVGITGMMIPNPVTSIRSVTKINPKAAFF